MRLIGLNCWGGHEFEGLIDFIRTQKDSTDIFCFQEVFSTSSDKKDYKGYRFNLLAEFSAILDQFSYIYVPMMSGAFLTHEIVNFDLDYGLVIFYRKEFERVGTYTKTALEYEIDIEGRLKHDITAKVQAIELVIHQKKFTILNFHGKAFPGNKLDTDERIEQSSRIVEVLKGIEGETILTGDFNLLPTTKSIQMIDEYLKNLITEFGITQTRSILTGYRGKVDEQFFADYTFVSSGIKVKSFSVPDLTISDHLPMILEFEV